MIQPHDSPYGMGTLDGLAWRPGTMNVSHLKSTRIVAWTDVAQHLDFTATRSGTWPIEVIASEGWTAYRLSWSVGSSSSSGGTFLK